MVQKKTTKKTTKTQSSKSTSASKRKVSSKPITKKNTSKHTSHSSKKRKESNKKYIIHSVIVAIVLLLLIFVFKNIFTDSPSNDTIVAEFDDTQITSSELTIAYDKLPDEFKSMITKEQYLEELYVPQRIILEKASVISDDRVQTEFNNFLEMSGQTQEEVEQTLADNGVTQEEFMDSLKIQIFLNDTLFDKIETTQEEITTFYETNKESITDENGEVIAFEDVETDIKAFIHAQKLQEETTVYIEELKTTMEIKIYSENINPVIEDIGDDVAGEKPKTVTDSSFDLTGDEICTEDGKPVIRMFSTTWCPHCKWITPIFEKVIQPYVESGQIAAYAWELDINDNILTDAKETSIPESEMAIYQKYNPQGSIPTFVFGCKYARVGNGFEGKADGEASEETDFTQTIEELIASVN